MDDRAQRGTSTRCAGRQNPGGSQIIDSQKLYFQCVAVTGKLTNGLGNGLRRAVLLGWVLLAVPPVSTAATAFICEDGSGHRSIQDRPCSAASASRTVEIESPSGRAGRPGATSHRPSAKALPQRGVDRGWSVRDASRCRQYQEGKFQVQSRMRAGYSVSEGERLRAGLEKLNGMLEAHCRKVPQEHWIRGNASDDVSD